MDNDWLSVAFGTGLFFIVGLLFLYNTLTHFFPFTEATLFSLSLGSLFSIAPVLNIPAVQLWINKQTHKQVFNVQKARIVKSSVVGNIEAGRDVTVLQFSGAQKTDTEYPISADFSLKAEGDYRQIALDMTKGGRLDGYVRADEDVWVYILSPQSLKSFKEGSEFRAKWKAPRVSYTPVSFTAPKTGRFHFLVTNDVVEEGEEYEKDRDEEELDDVSVEMRLKKS